jgi:hypothetical protein
MMVQPFDAPQVVPPEKWKPQDYFQHMHDQIVHNANSDFGGAFVIIPPGQDDGPLTGLILSDDPAHFWMVLHAKVQTRLQEMQDKERQNAAFRPR